MSILINIILLLVILYVLWQVYRFIRGMMMSPLERFRRHRLPAAPASSKLAKSADHLETLVNHIHTSLQRTTRLTGAQKKALRAQVRQVQRNITELLWKMDQLQALRDGVKDPGHQLELMTMQRKLQAEIDHSLEVLEATSVDLMKFDVLSGERGASRLLTDLTETSQRLAHTGESYEEMQRVRRLSR